MQARTVVVALNIPSRNSAEYDQFREISFDKKLQLFSQHIHAICQKLQRDENADQWIISWREYGLQNSDSRYISMNDRKKLKEVMQKITAAYPKLTIISGSVAVDRKLEAMDVTARNVKLDRVKTGYLGNAKQLHDDIQFKRHAQHASNSMSLINKSPLAKSTKSSVVRNVSYVFRGGQCVARHDKRAPHKELHGLETEATSIFRPGRDRSYRSFINTEIGIEICREHTKGTLRQECESDGIVPKIQFILSDSITYQPWQQISPYAIQIDSVESIALITDIDASQLDVTLYEHNMTDEENNLKPVPAVRKKEAVIKQIEDHIGNKYVPHIQKYLAHNLFDSGDCERILALMPTLILLPRFANDFEKLKYFKKFAEEVNSLLSYLGQLNPAIDARIKLLISTASAAGIIAENAATEKALQRPQISDHILVILAAQRSCLGLLKKLLYQGFDANSALADGTTALMAAANAGHVNIVRTLLASPGMQLNALRSVDKFMPLQQRINI